MINPKGLNYNDEWRFLNQFIDNKIKECRQETKAYFCEVILSNGYYVNVKIVGEQGLQPLLNIPIIQSKYYSVITMPGDKGILLNLYQNLSQTLENKTSDILQSDYYVFLPLICKKDYKGDFNKQRLNSSLLNSFLEIADDGLTLESIDKINIKADNTAGVETKELTIKADNTAGVETKELTIKGDSKITIESASELTIKAGAPIEFGTSQQLGAVLADICTALQSFKTLPTSPGAPAMADPGFVSNIASAQAKLSQILKS